MDRMDNSIDKRFASKAQTDLADVPDQLWERLEERLDRRSVVRRWRYISGVAAGIALLFSATFLINFPSDNIGSITDLSEESGDRYYTDYRDFLRSEKYAKLIDQYQKSR